MMKSLYTTSYPLCEPLDTPTPKIVTADILKQAKNQTTVQIEKREGGSTPIQCSSCSETAAKTNFNQLRKICSSALDLIGNTPMVRLDRLKQKYGIQCDLVAKCEFLSVGGSVKDRIGLKMITDAEKKGQLHPNTQDIIVEATSGNTGIGLCLVGAVKGYRVIITLPEKMSKEKLITMSALGAEIIRTPTAASWDSLDGHIGLATQLQQILPNCHFLNQYINPGNPQAHYLHTAEEIWYQCDHHVDMIVIGAGTGGTISGVGAKLKEYNPLCQIIGVDPMGSILSVPEELNEQKKGESYLVEGIGYDFIPATLHRDYVDQWIKTDDNEAFRFARELIRLEGLLVGGSSGAAIAGALKIAKTLKSTDRCVVLLPDSSRNYMTKFLCDDWMIDHGFYKSCLSLNEEIKQPLNKKNNVKLLPSYWIKPTQTCQDVLNLMKKGTFNQLPVMNGNQLIGIIELSILLKGMFNQTIHLQDNIRRHITTQYKTVLITSPISEILRSLEFYGYVVELNNRKKEVTLTEYALRILVMVPAQYHEERNCQVVLRIRPLTQIEEVQDVKQSFNWNAIDHTLTILHSQQRYQFDRVFGPESSQNDIFESSCLPMVNLFFEGYNCCIFAYGQTGSGKTFTMGTALHMTSQSNNSCGIIPRAASKICHDVAELKKSGQSVHLDVSFIEVYNEDLRDLLDTNGMISLSQGGSSTIRSNGIVGKSIRITEDPITKAICMLGATKINIDSENDLFDCLSRGGLCRMTASNNLNMNSSRSHAIFTLSMTTGTGDQFITRKFHFVDLAGSERIKRTGAEGARLKEGICINAGLLALSNVINALTTEQRLDGQILSYVPYRDSKLTRILQDSLGGNSRTLMIACLSAAPESFAETYNTIKYAIRARNIQNVPIINRDPHTTLIEDYQRRIHELTLQLLVYRQAEAKHNHRNSTQDVTIDSQKENGVTREDYTRSNNEIMLRTICKDLRKRLIPSKISNNSIDPTETTHQNESRQTQNIKDSTQDDLEFKQMIETTPGGLQTPLRKLCSINWDETDEETDDDMTSFHQTSTIHNTIELTPNIISSNKTHIKPMEKDDHDTICDSVPSTTLKAQYNALNVNIGRTDLLLKGVKTEQAQYMTLVGDMRLQLSQLTRQLTRSTEQREHLKHRISQVTASQENALNTRETTLQIRYKEEINKVKQFRKQLAQLTRQLDRVTKGKFDSEKEIKILQMNLKLLRLERQKTKQKIREQDTKYQELVAKQKIVINQMKKKEAQRILEYKKKELIQRKQFDRLQKEHDQFIKKYKLNDVIINQRQGLDTKSFHSHSLISSNIIDQQQHSFELQHFLSLGLEQITKQERLKRQIGILISDITEIKDEICLREEQMTPTIPTHHSIHNNFEINIQDELEGLRQQKELKQQQLEQTQKAIQHLQIQWPNQLSPSGTSELELLLYQSFNKHLLAVEPTISQGLDMGLIPIRVTPNELKILFQYVLELKYNQSILTERNTMLELELDDLQSVYHQLLLGHRTFELEAERQRLNIRHHGYNNIRSSQNLFYWDTQSSRTYTYPSLPQRILKKTLKRRGILINQCRRRILLTKFRKLTNRHPQSQQHQLLPSSSLSNNNEDDNVWESDEQVDTVSSMISNSLEDTAVKKRIHSRLLMLQKERVQLLESRIENLTTASTFSSTQPTSNESTMETLDTFLPDHTTERLDHKSSDKEIVFLNHSVPMTQSLINDKQQTFSPDPKRLRKLSSTGKPLYNQMLCINPLTTADNSVLPKDQIEQPNESDADTVIIDGVRFVKNFSPHIPLCYDLNKITKPKNHMSPMIDYAGNQSSHVISPRHLLINDAKNKKMNPVSKGIHTRGFSKRSRISSLRPSTGYDFFDHSSKELTTKEKIFSGPKRTAISQPPDKRIGCSRRSDSTGPVMRKQQIDQCPRYSSHHINKENGVHPPPLPSRSHMSEIGFKEACSPPFNIPSRPVSIPPKNKSNQSRKMSKLAPSNQTNKHEALQHTHYRAGCIPQESDQEYIARPYQTKRYIAWNSHKISPAVSSCLDLGDKFGTSPLLLTANQNGFYSWDINKVFTDHISYIQQPNAVLPNWSCKDTIISQGPNSSKHIRIIEEGKTYLVSFGTMLGLLDIRMPNIAMSWKYGPDNSSLLSKESRNNDGQITSRNLTDATVNGIIIIPSNSICVGACGTDSAIRLYDVRQPSARPLCRLSSTSQPIGLEYYTNDTSLFHQGEGGNTESKIEGIIAAGADGVLRVWMNGWYIITPDHSNTITGLLSLHIPTFNYNINSNILLSGSKDARVRIWDRSLHMPENRNPLYRLSTTIPLDSPVHSLAGYSPNTNTGQDALLAIGTQSGNVTLWNISNEENTSSITSNLEWSSDSVTFQQSTNNTSAVNTTNAGISVKPIQLALPTPPLMNMTVAEGSNVMPGYSSYIDSKQPLRVYEGSSIQSLALGRNYVVSFINDAHMYLHRFEPDIKYTVIFERTGDTDNTYSESVKMRKSADIECELLLWKKAWKEVNTRCRNNRQRELHKTGTSAVVRKTKARKWREDKFNIWGLSLHRWVPEDNKEPIPLNTVYHMACKWSSKLHSKPDVTDDISDESSDEWVNPHVSQTAGE